MSEYDATNAKVKTRKIRKTDWQSVEDFLKKELDKRKNSSFRKQKETIWAEVDRQIAMQPMKKFLPNGKEAPSGWKSAFELGELSKASEVITADVMRLVFPANRTWFEPHCKPPTSVDPQTGKAKVAINQDQQDMADGIARSLMSQQHEDFGMVGRVELSVKEALHHGGFVATVEWDKQNKIHDGKGVESLSAPVWIPHSMWNCYPDSSPSIIPGAIFYPGSMMITSFMPRHKVLELKGSEYMNLSDAKIPKKKNKNKDVDTEDVEILTYYGDLSMPREDGDIFLPNSKCMTANGTIIYYASNPLPFPEVIYQGYERQDLRDPYFTSPIVKNSPIQKLATILANQFIDGVDMHSNPPVVYDGNDPYMVANGGLNMWPGAQTASKGSNKFQEVKIGEPKYALEGLQLALTKLEEGTAVNAIRSGGNDSDRKTATEVQKTAQGSEVRTVDFVGKLERGALRPFLYMQHELNLKNLDSYSFYCAEQDLPDFITVKKQDLPAVMHFEVVGSKGLLGEEQRTQRMTAVTAFASGNPLFAPLLNAQELLKDMYEDAGVKGAEKYINPPQAPQIPPELQAKMQEMQQQMQQMAQELQKAKAGEAVQLQKLELEKAKAQGEMALKNAELELEKQKAMASDRADKADLMAKIDAAQNQLALEVERMNREFALEAERMRNDLAMQGAELRLAHEKANAELTLKHEQAKAATAEKKRSATITRTATGYKVDD